MKLLQLDQTTGLADRLFGFISAAGAALALLAAVRFVETGGSIRYLGWLAVASAFAAAGFVARRWRSETRIGLLVSISSLGVSLLVVEGVLRAFVPTMQERLAECRRSNAADLGVESDERTKLEVIRDMRREGLPAYPAPTNTLLREQRFLRTARQEGVVPYAGISGVLSVLGKENGGYASYWSDEHGFNNPEGLWDDAEAALLGDSYVHGVDVAQGEDIAGQLRSLGLRALNLGISGNGPLENLAILTEYARPVRARLVVWVFYEGNDLIASGSEAASERYVDDPTYSQDLLGRQEELDKLLRTEIDERLEREWERKQRSSGSWARKITSSAPGEFLRLPVLRARLELLYASALDLTAIQQEGMRRLEAALSRARDQVRSWGGNLYFVYLPSWLRLEEPESRGIPADRDEVLALTKRLEIPVIDLVERFRTHPDRRFLYPLGCFGGHLSPRGYRLIAETIHEHLAGAR